MKILPLSDLHLEWGSKITGMEFCEDDKTDTVAVLAGDIHNGNKAVDWIEENLVGKVLAVVYVPGNHEFYGYNFHEVVPSLKKEVQLRGLDNNIFVLDDESIPLGDVEFIGSTLWTDMDNMNSSIMTIAKDGMNDYNHIYTGITVPSLYGTYYRQPIRPMHTVEKHVEAVNFITERLDTPSELKRVVVTHHLPSHECIMPWFKDPSRCDAVSLALNHAYASNLDYLLDRNDISLWIHGHNHAAYQDVKGRTLVVSNAYGYPGSTVRGFDPNLRIQV